ncbi:MAG TPA: sensor histidine kinase [Opitutus sp.]|nr:sensor histidine kinase [Opitutus sp.]
MSTVFVALVWRYDRVLRRDIHARMIQRDAAVLTAVANQEIETGAVEPARTNAERWLEALLPAAHRQGVLAMAIYDADGVVLVKIPSNQLVAELPPDDFVQLQTNRPLTRYWPAFLPGTLLVGAAMEPTPVLEIVLPLHGRHASASPRGTTDPIGYVRYDLDARELAVELAALDAGVRRQSVLMLAAGLAALGLLVAGAYALLRRAQRIIAERTARLQRANFDLSLAAKTSALGQLASHLVHGLQGSVAGLRSVVTAPDGNAATDWKAAAGYAEQMQSTIAEVVGLLGDHASAVTYELTGRDLADTIRRRNEAASAAKGVALRIDDGFPGSIDSHRGGLLCLIASNLVQNAIEASAPSGRVTVSMRRDSGGIALQVADNGPGIPPAVREHLFEPGSSGRPGGTGLGLAISRLLAQQIGATLVLDATGADGTTFRLTLPVESPADNQST